MNEEHVTAEHRGPVLVIRFVNHKKRNSMTAEFRQQLSAALDTAVKDERVKVVYMTGSGAAFCSGGDLQMLKNGSDPWAVHQRYQQLGKWLLPLMHLEKPVVVGVNGFAVGGGIGIALSGDVVIASESAKFVPGFFRLGVVPDVCTMHTLPRLIGLARAKQFLFADEALSAHDALQMGLVSRVVPDGELDAECLARAERLASGPTSVMGLAKLLMARTFENGLDDMFLLERLGQALSMSSGEFHERLERLLTQVNRVDAADPVVTKAARVAAARPPRSVT